jgi:hypothetical protein
VPFYDPKGRRFRRHQDQDLATGAAGLLAGQVVRQAKRLVQGYPVTVEDDKEAA